MMIKKTVLHVFETGRERTIHFCTHRGDNNCVDVLVGQHPHGSFSSVVVHCPITPEVAQWLAAEVFVRFDEVASVDDQSLSPVDRFKASMQTPSVRPDWSPANVPMCTEDCPSNFGKECNLMGCKTGSVCQPAVVELVSRAKRTVYDEIKTG